MHASASRNQFSVYLVKREKNRRERERERERACCQSAGLLHLQGRQAGRQAGKK